MERDQVLDRIREHLATELEVDAARIDSSTRFKEDLEADSLDLVELVMELEDSYGIKIPDDEAARLPTGGQAAEWIAARAPQNATRPALDTLASLLDELPDDLAKQAFTHASWVDKRAD